jgi:Leucine-rich repeat (LRR) protein
VYVGSHLNLRGTLVIQDFPQLKEINCVANSFTSLIVNNCPQLSEINCHSNQLTSLEISDCPNISQLICSDNQLTNLDFLNNLNPEKLVHLQMGGNKECRQDLNIFSKFVKLEYLDVNNNSLYGSLEPLNNCRSLK